MYKMKTRLHTVISHGTLGKIMCNGANGIVMETVFQLRADYMAWLLMFAAYKGVYRWIFP